MTTYLDEGFENNNFNLWDGTVGSPTIVTSPVHHGTYAMQAVFAGSYEEHDAYKAFGSWTGNAYVRMYFRSTAFSVSGFHTLLSIDQTPDYTVLAKVVINSTTLRLAKTKPTAANVDYSYSFQTGTWYCLEFMYKKDASVGGYRIYLNGTEVITDIALNTDTWTFYRIFVGQYSEDGGAATYNIDDVVVADAYIGPMVTSKNYGDGLTWMHY